MQEYIDKSIIVADTTNSAAKTNFYHMAVPEEGYDPDLKVTRETLVYCPSCGEKIQLYVQTLPAPTAYTHALTTGAACNDPRCPHFVANTEVCGLNQAFLSIGCYMDSDGVRLLVKNIKTRFLDNVSGMFAGD